MIRVIATFLIEPGKEDQAMDIAKELVDITRTEQGCVHYNFLRSIEQENTFVMIEGWETQADLDVHSASEHFSLLVPQLAALCTQAPSVAPYKQVI